MTTPNQPKTLEEAIDNIARYLAYELYREQQEKSKKELERSKI